MSMGPIQFVAYGFDTIDRFRGQILDELDRLEASGLIRVMDVLFMAKERNGDIVVLELDDETADGAGDGEIVDAGELLAMLLGLDMEAGEDSSEGAAADTDRTAGLSQEDIVGLADELEPGTAAGLLLVEHRWAAGFRDAVASAGGTPLLQGFLSPDALIMIGAEALATAEALEAIEAAAAVEGAAVLRSIEALAVVDDVENAVRAVIAAEALQALVDGGIVPTASALDGARVLAEAGLIDEALVG